MPDVNLAFVADLLLLFWGVYAFFPSLFSVLSPEMMSGIAFVSIIAAVVLLASKA